MIPKNIHLIYKSHTIPEPNQQYLQSIKKMHPKWDIKIYSDEEARTIVADKMPDILPVYDSYKLDVQRADVLRLVLVHLYGGFYMDLDMLCLKSIDELCAHQMVLAEEKTMTEKECSAAGVRDKLRIANYMFGAVPGHGFLMDVITAIMETSTRGIIFEDDVLETTGPGLFTTTFHLQKEKYDDIVILLNKNNKCRKWCKTISCHFGDYAAHFHQGSWRWEKGYV